MWRFDIGRTTFFAYGSVRMQTRQGATHRRSARGFLFALDASGNLLSCFLGFFFSSGGRCGWSTTAQRTSGTVLRDRGRRQRGVRPRASVTEYLGRRARATRDAASLEGSESARAAQRAGAFILMVGDGDLKAGCLPTSGVVRNSGIVGSGKSA